MSILFEAAFAFVVSVEGIYSDNPLDRGNWTGGKIGVGVLAGTKYGISAASFPLLDIRNVTLDQAKEIYLQHFWTPIAGDQLPAPVAVAVFDQAVNQGVHSAVVTLQRAVGTDPDGWIGSETLNAANAKNPRDTVLEICSRRALAYAGDPQIATDGLGWMRRLFKLATQFQSKDAS